MKISIITATYKSSTTIADCVRSVIDQSFSNIEQLIVDGASRGQRSAGSEQTPEVRLPTSLAFG